MRLIDRTRYDTSFKQQGAIDRTLDNFEIFAQLQASCPIARV
ncbi:MULTISPECIES: hypothetical protein [unclassified Microcoleus]|nr:MULTISPECIES: hypothetical protein [unclassified Microcoleus]